MTQSIPSRLQRANYPSFSGPSYGQISCGLGYETAQLSCCDAASSMPASTSRPFLLQARVVNTSASHSPANGRRRNDNNDIVEDVNDGEGYRRREKFLCCCCAALTVGLLAVSAFLLLSYLPAFRPPSQKTSNCAGSGGYINSGRASAPASYCLSRACLKSAAEMEEMLNKTADPCEEFFAFSCDGWLNENHMPPTVSVWSRSTRLQAGVDNHLREMLESGDDNSPSWRLKLRQFFEACISVEDPRLAQCSSSSAPTSAGSSGDEFQTLLNTCQGRRRLTDRIICLQMELGVESLFRMQPVESPWSPREQILLLDEHQDWKLGDFADPREQNQLRQFIVQLVNDLEHLGDSVGKNYADSVLTVLQSLAQISHPANHPLKDQPLMRAERFTVGEFQRRLEADGSLIQFDKLIAEFLHGNAKHPVDSMVIAVGNPGYFYQLGSLLKRLRDDDLKKYLEFCIILRFAPFYSAKSRRDSLRHSAQLNGQEHAEEDWLTCLRLLRSPGLNAVYFEEAQSRLRLELVSAVLVPLLKEAFVDLTRSSPRLSQQVKNSIAQKVQSMRIIVGYSELHLKQDFLNQYFLEWNLTSNQTLLQMALGWTKLRQSKTRSRLKDNRYDFREDLDITSVSPSYRAEANAVFIPAAFFQWPFHLWDNTMPYYLKFGIIGTAIATEMTRAFDAVGSRWALVGEAEAADQTAASGYSPPLLLGADTEDCMASLLPTGHSTSKSAIREAFAFAWGLRVANLAHRTHLTRRSDMPLGLPTVSYAPHQLVFMAFAQSHCGTERPELRARLQRSYVPLKSRVELAVQGLSDFGEAFGCGLTQRRAAVCQP